MTERYHQPGCEAVARFACECPQPAVVHLRYYETSFAMNKRRCGSTRAATVVGDTVRAEVETHSMRFVTCEACKRGHEDDLVEDATKRLEGPKSSCPKCGWFSPEGTERYTIAGRCRSCGWPGK